MKEIHATINKVRLCLGCAVVTLENKKGEPLLSDNGKPIHEGGQANPLNYSGKTVVTIKDFGEMMKEQKEHVRNLKMKGDWNWKYGDDGVIYQSNKVN